jgi:hypothetical protein
MAPIDAAELPVDGERHETGSVTRAVRFVGALAEKPAIPRSGGAIEGGGQIERRLIAARSRPHLARPAISLPRPWPLYRRVRSANLKAAKTP